MKTSKMMLTKVTKALAEKALRRDANSTTCVAFYQPKAPEKLKQFKNSK